MARPVLVRNPSTYSQAFVTPATVWTVAHNLGYAPHVEARDEDGNVMLCEIQHTSLFQTKITFVAAQTGYVRCG